MSAILYLPSPSSAQGGFDNLIFDAVLLTPDVQPPSRPAEAADPVIPEQDADEPGLQVQIQRYRDSIASLASSEVSPYSEALREQYHALALLLQQEGNHEAAIEVLDAAMHIDRVNHGLFTPRQVALVENLIQSRSALGQYDSVDDLEEYLFYINTKAFPADDPQRLAATERWADWNVESFLKAGPRGRFGNALSFSSSSTDGMDYVAIQDQFSGEVFFVPRDRMPFLLNPSGMPGGGNLNSFSLRSSPYTVSPETLVDDRLREAEDLYDSLLEDNATKLTLEQRVDIEQKRANVAYAVKRQMQAMTSAVNQASFGFNRPFGASSSNPVVSRSYSTNAESLEALAGDVEADPAASTAEKAQAWLAVADWHLGFERYKAAQESYQRAWELLGSPSTDPPGLHPVLHPGYIMPVPAFAEHPYSRAIHGLAPDAPLDYKGWLDVTLELDKSGRVRREKIIGASNEDESLQLRRALLDYLSDNRMRPFIRNGEPVDVEGLNLRFYYWY